MIQITPTFLYELYERFRNKPGETAIKLYYPNLTRTGKKVTVDYNETLENLPNPVFPIELISYRRAHKIKLSIDEEFESKFADKNIGSRLYDNDDDTDDAKNDRITDLIDLCRQYMNKDLEQELEDEVHLFESMDDAADTKSYEYLYDLFETVKTFNDYLSIVFLNLANILTYPNETFYEKYKKRSIRIKPDDAIKMANKICKRMQNEFEYILLKNFPIGETVNRITKVEKDTKPDFDPDDITMIETSKSRSKIIKKEK